MIKLFFILLLTTALAGCTATTASEQTHQHGATTIPDAVSAAQSSINKTPPPSPAPEGMVWVPGGTFWMGCDDCNMPDAEPVHLVTVDGYWIDTTPVTNAEFAKFVKATGYKTIAEIRPKEEDFPGVPASKLVAGSAIFNAPKQEVGLENPLAWWKYQAGANWRHPEGPRSAITNRMDHPVVHVSWVDAVAYAKWAGKRIPTEAEFEFAARGGLDRNKFAWGNELKPNGKWVANIWQGKFPNKDGGDDGFKSTTSPVKYYPANSFGLFDVGGNVWQWCSDWYRPDYFQTSDPKVAIKNPTGPSDSIDPDEPGIPKRVQKSGSYLCSDQYCARYHVGSRGKGEPGSGGSNVGFRCVKS